MGNSDTFRRNWDTYFANSHTAAELDYLIRKLAYLSAKLDYLFRKLAYLSAKLNYLIRKLGYRGGTGLPNSQTRIPFSGTGLPISQTELPL